MIANRILYLITSLLSLLVIPIQVVTTFVLGIAVVLTFGFLLLPLSLIWAFLLFPMVGLSWICHKAPALRNVIGILFIPWVVVAETFVALTPAMGELESRAAKMMLCDAWPYTWEFWHFLSGRTEWDSAGPASVALNEIVARMSRVPLMQRVIMRVSMGQPLDQADQVPITPTIG